MSQRRHHNHLQRSAFSLVELLIVLSIIALIVGLVLPNLIGIGEGAKQDAAEAQIKAISTAILAFYLDMNRYPASLDELVTSQGSKWNGPYMQDGVVPKDPWGNPFQYSAPGGDDRAYDIICYGQDGTSGGEGLKRDIVSWHTADE